MLRAYGVRIGLCAVVGLLLGLLISLVTPRKYEAAIQILVDPHLGQPASALTPAERQISDIYDSTAPRTVQTQVEQLTGFKVLDEAAKAVATRRGVSAQSLPELSLINLQKSITVEAVSESDLVTLRIRLSDKDLAAEVAQAIYDAFDDQNHTQSQEAATRAIAVLQSQTAKIDKQLADIDTQLEVLRKKYRAPSIELLVQADVENVKAMQQVMDAAKAEMSAARTRASTLREQLKSVFPTIEAGTTTAPNPIAQQVESQLANARAALAQARIRYEDDHPAVKEQMALVQRYQTELDGLKKQIQASSQKTPNPVYQTLSTQLAAAESEAAGAETKYLTAQTQAAGHTQELSNLPEVQRKMLVLARKQDTLTRLSLDYSQELTTLEAAQRGRLTASTVVSPAIAFPDPVSPNFPLNLGAGLIGGLLLGLLSSFGSESRRSPIRSLSQLNRLTLEPAFRTIPELPFVPIGTDKRPDDVFVALLGNFTRSGKRPYRIGVIGVDADSGATVAACGMAMGAAEEQTAALLVDTARDRGASKRLGISSSETLVDLSSTLTVYRTGGEEHIQANTIFETIQGLEQSHPLTVIDLPPFRANGNPVMYLAGLDECLLLVRAGRTRTVDFLQAQQMLIDSGIPLVTVVLSRARSLDDDFTFMPSEVRS